MNNIIYYSVVLCLVRLILSPVYAESNDFQYHPNKQDALIIYDYEVITLPGDNEAIDLFGSHYLQRLNDWFYLGFGVHAPLFHGNYGGFMTLDATAHAQQKISDDFYINLGVSFGGGGGGSSVEQSAELSGTGGFIKKYVGLGYEINEGISVGVNYANMTFKDSLIHNSQVNFFVQTPVSYSVSAYSDTGKLRRPIKKSVRKDEMVFSFEFNNLFQINPQGTSKQTINNVSLQISHFIDDVHYLYLGAEVGYKGLALYNHFLHGIGRRTMVSERTALYSQFAIGSGGFSTDKVDTDAGLLIYPKISLEYLASKDLGVSLSTGYLVYPLGSSKNVTFGAGVNFYFSKKHFDKQLYSQSKYDGIRISLYNQVETSVEVNRNKHHDIRLISFQLDKIIKPNWYFSTQIALAYNKFVESPGYGELFAGIGVQSQYAGSERFQNFFQLMVGTNHNGVLFKPMIGTNYTINDYYALFLQVGRTMSIHGLGLYQEDKSFNNYNVGLGLTYRFSL